MSNVLLAWNPSPGASFYDAYRDGVRITPAGGITASSYLDSNVAPGTHSYDVDAGNAAGTSAASATVQATVPPNPSGRVAVSGAGLVRNGAPFRLKAATAYGLYSTPATAVADALQAGLNAIEMVEFDSQYHVLADCMSEATWRRADAFIAAAKAAGLLIVLNLSEYGQSLNAAGYTSTAEDWGPYLSFIASRVNTVTGIRYADEPAIAMVKLFGEIPAPNYSDPGRGTTAQMTAFFARSLAQWRVAAPLTLGSTGGFSYLNDPNCGIDWRTIMADPNCPVCEFEINSYDDRNITLPMVSAYAVSIGKPWILAAWSACYGDPRGTWDLDHYPSDATMALHATDMYQCSSNTLPATLPPGLTGRPASAAAGNHFWNLGSKSTYNATCEIGPQFPLTLAAVQAGR